MSTNSGHTPFVSLSPYQQVIHKTRYAKWNKAEKRRETIDETITRYFDYFGNYLNRHFNYQVPDSERQELFAAVRNLGVQPSMRALMTAGPALESAQMANYNCTYLPIDAVESFCEMMYILMTGSGVGFSVERVNVNKLPKIMPYIMGNVHIIVEDSREGWCDAYGHLLDALYRGCTVTWDTSRVRPKGSRLETFGGYSSGPEPLEELFKHTVAIFAEALHKGMRLSPKQVFSLCTMIAQIVVVGGVRRSATICLFDKDDLEMLNVKGADSQMYIVEDGVWKPGPNAHYAMANISAVFEETPSREEFDKFWSALRDGGFGEPGIFNRQAVREAMDKIGRPNHYKDGTPIAWGVNPCCVAAGTLVDTTRGRIAIESVAAGDEVWVKGEKHVVAATLHTGRKDCLRIACGDGAEIIVTPDHQVLTVDGYKRADTLSIKDKIVTSRMPVTALIDVDAEGWLVGNCIGDGHITTDLAALDYWGADIEDVYPKAVERMKEAFGGNRYGPNNVGERASVYRRVGSKALHDAVLRVADYSKTLDAAKLASQSDRYVASLVRGLFDADGTVSINNDKGITVRLSSVNLNNLRVVKDALARLGVGSRLYVERSAACTARMPDGRGGKKEYPKQASHELCIGGDNLARFAAAIGFDTPHKAARLTHAIATVKNYCVEWTRVLSIEEDTEHEVYDLDVPTARAFVANGLVVHNCEIILRPYQACNLSSAVIRADDTYDTLAKKVEQATILGTWQAAVTRFQYLRPIWRENIEEEALLGVCLSGFYDHAILGHDSEECDKWLRDLQQVAWTVNKEYAAKIGINPATSVTAVKPSGNSGELADSASGIHPRHSKYYIRRIRQSGTDPMSAFLEAVGIPCEVSLQNERDRVFSFLIKAPENAVTITDITAIQQLDHWLHVKRAWATHTVSCTINIKGEEWKEVEEWVYANFDSITGLSFFPFFENGFKQAPFEAITVDEYAALCQDETTEIDWSLLKHFESADVTATGQEFTCIGGACTL